MLTEPDERDKKGKAVSAIVVDLLPRSTYRLKLENEQEVLAHPAGSVTTNFVRLRVGDCVAVEISPYDRSRGRIVRVLKESGIQ